MAANDEINARLAGIFVNGPIEVGLEVGADPGLPPVMFTQIPRSMVKAYNIRLTDEGYAQAVEHGSIPDPRQRDGSNRPIGDLPEIPEEYEGDGTPGWIHVAEDDRSKLILRHNGESQVVFLDEDADLYEAHRYAVEELDVPPPTYGDIRAFYTLNRAAVGEAEFDEDIISTIIATRFWAVVCGMVVAHDATEYTVVDTPAEADFHVNSAAFSQQAVSEQALGEAITWVAARAISWKKSNHATGGVTATGFPRRVLEKAGLWPATSDSVADRQVHNRSTSAFYRATHAASVHALLALLAPDDDHHFAYIDARYGIRTEWDVKQSVSVRMSPRNQIAGAARVTDCVEVLRMLTVFGLAVLLESIDQHSALLEAYGTVSTEGMRVATYAGWFFRDHPDQIKPVPFSQTSATFAALISELAVAGVTFLGRSTIGQSPALKAAAGQTNDEILKQKWARLAVQKQISSTEDFIKTASVLTSAVSTTTTRALFSRDDGEAEAAVNLVNSKTRQVASALGISPPAALTLEEVRSHAAAVTATAA